MRLSGIMEVLGREHHDQGAVSVDGNDLIYIAPSCVCCEDLLYQIELFADFARLEE